MFKRDLPKDIMKKRAVYYFIQSVIAVVLAVGITLLLNTCTSISKPVVVAIGVLIGSIYRLDKVYTFTLFINGFIYIYSEKKDKYLKYEYDGKSKSQLEIIEVDAFGKGNNALAELSLKEVKALRDKYFEEYNREMEELEDDYENR